MFLLYNLLYNFKMSPILKIYKVVVNVTVYISQMFLKGPQQESLYFCNGSNPRHLKSFYDHLAIVLHVIIKTYQPPQCCN